MNSEKEVLDLRGVFPESGYKYIPIEYWDEIKGRPEIYQEMLQDAQKQTEQSIGDCNRIMNSYQYDLKDYCKVEKEIKKAIGYRWRLYEEIETADIVMGKVDQEIAYFEQQIAIEMAMLEDDEKTLTISEEKLEVQIKKNKIIDTEALTVLTDKLEEQFNNIIENSTVCNKNSEEPTCSKYVPAVSSDLEVMKELSCEREDSKNVKKKSNIKVSSLEDSKLNMKFNSGDITIEKKFVEKSSDISQVEDIENGSDVSLVADVDKDANVAQVVDIEKNFDISQVKDAENGSHISQIADVENGSDVSDVAAAVTNVSDVSFGSQDTGVDSTEHFENVRHKINGSSFQNEIENNYDEEIVLNLQSSDLRTGNMMNIMNVPATISPEDIELISKCAESSMPRFKSLTCPEILRLAQDSGLMADISSEQSTIKTNDDICVNIEKPKSRLRKLLANIAEVFPKLKNKSEKKKQNIEKMEFLMDEYIFQDIVVEDIFKDVLKRYDEKQGCFSVLFKRQQKVSVKKELLKSVVNKLKYNIVENKMLNSGGDNNAADKMLNSGGDNNAVNKMLNSGGDNNVADKMLNSGGDNNAANKMLNSDGDGQQNC